jgi:hypothetical protein
VCAYNTAHEDLQEIDNLIDTLLYLKQNFRGLLLYTDFCQAIDKYSSREKSLWRPLCSSLSDEL